MPAALSPETVRHAELMDRVYRHQRHIYDFTRKYYLFGRDRLIAGLKLGPGTNLVEVGCGTGRNLIAIARRYPESCLYGLDASEAMLETARVAVARAGLSRRVRLVHGLAEELSPVSFGLESFDNILFSYSLSMIPDWRGALAVALDALAPKGRLHVVDFGDLGGLGRVARYILRAWLALFHVSPRVEFLRALEDAAGRRRRLTLLPGRYAFIFSCGKNPDRD